MIVLNRAAAIIAASALRGVSLAVKDWGLFIDFLLVATSEAEDVREAQFAAFLSENADA
jgi:hypothetical protein